MNNIQGWFNVAPGLIDKKFLIRLSQEITITNAELEILNEFAYFAPDPDQIPELMKNFYKEYYMIATNKFDIDQIVTKASWIIKNFCDIHPFEDGNGRVARALAFNFITSQTKIQFNDEEIDSYGKSKSYIEATSRINQNPEKFELLKQWILQVAQAKQNITATFNSDYIPCGTSSGTKEQVQKRLHPAAKM